MSIRESLTLAARQAAHRTVVLPEECDRMVDAVLDRLASLTEAEVGQHLPEFRRALEMIRSEPLPVRTGVDARPKP